MIDVKIIKDSIGPTEIRLTTFQLVYPRYIHPQILTHRVFSRSAASSRAIPTSKLLRAAYENPVNPIHWGENQRGMVAQKEINELSRQLAQSAWNDARDYAFSKASELEALGVHKQVVNRLIEPFLTIRVVLTATDFRNFYALRIDDSAQPEIQKVATLMRDAQMASEPEYLKAWNWHLPYVDENLHIEDAIKVSVARCARVSYKTFDDNQKSTLAKDIALHDKLLKLKHMSPMEHVAYSSIKRRKVANFRGWIQYRYLIDNTGAEQH